MADITLSGPAPNPDWEAPTPLQKAHNGTPLPDKTFGPDDEGMTIEVREDGGVDFVYPAPAVHRPRTAENFGENLAGEFNESALQSLASDYLDGVASDILSRSQFIQNYNRGIDLLGLKIEEPSAARGSRTSISKIKHPALLEACVQSQATSQAQLLPAAGPVKVQTIGASSGPEDNLARDFEDDFNYYLTEVDKGYYPDTKQALFYRAFGGTIFKKVYYDPIRRMPLSRFISITDLIVSEDASDLESALRKTNEIMMTSQQIKRMQTLGDWLDVDLGYAQVTTSQSRIKEKNAAGLSQAQTRPQDVEHTIYEGYACFDPSDYGLPSEKNAPYGLPLPYKVVIDKDTQKVLALHRNWRHGDEEFRERQEFVKYGLVPGLGFLDYGFLHLIGNQTRVLTAIWQILVDKGILANFPGGVKAKSIRMSTNEINPGPGEWPDVDLNGFDDIRKAFMAMPYGDISQTFMAFAQSIEEDVKRLAGTVELEVGEGRTNVPVGTIMAMLEQQTQQMSAVHKSDHTSQKEELRLLRDLFVDHPEALTRLARNPKRKWQVGQEFADLNIVPVSDPNVPSQMHRIMQNQFLMDLAEKAPMLFPGPKMVKLADRIVTSIGVSDADTLLATPQEFMQAQQQMAQAAQKGKGGNGSGQAAIAKAQMELPLKQAQLQLDQSRLQIEQEQQQREAANQAADATQRQAEAQIESDKVDLARTEMALEHQRGMAEIAQDGAADPQDAADLQKSRAQAFQAVGQGAQAFANAAQTVSQGAQDTEAVEAGETPDTTPAPAPKPRLQRPNSKRNTPKNEGGI